MTWEVMILPPDSRTSFGPRLLGYARRVSLDPDAVRRDLDPFWRELQAVAETGSTNDDVLAAAAAGGPQGLVRVAEFQTAGRGRLNRKWDAAAGTSLMFSVLLRPSAPVARWGWLPLIAGLGIHDALREAGADVALKWPNDVQLGAERGKCGGILTQAAGGAAVVGIGLNVLRHDGLPDGAAAIEDEWTAPRERVLAAVLNAIASRYGEWDAAGGDVERSGLLAGYRAACGTLGQDVRVMLPARDEPVLGRAEDIDVEGRLIVSTPDGPLIVGAGDVVHVRPAR